MWEEVASIINKHRVAVQADLDDDEPEDWSVGIGLPTEGYGEVASYGPFSLKNLRMLVINPIETRRIGQRVPDKLIDHTASIMQELTDCGVAFERKDKLIVIHSIN
jgi:hypothetical protein